MLAFNLFFNLSLQQICPLHKKNYKDGLAIFGKKERLFGIDF
jgi:hypothetical protein